MPIPEYLIYVLPVFLVFIALEAVIYRQKKVRFPVKEAGISLLILGVYQLVKTQTGSLLSGVFAWFHSFRLWEVPTDTWWGVLLLFFGVEFAYYWLHRCAHEIRWMWASHNVHHSPETITFSGAYRLAITSPLSGLFIFFIPLFVLGFDPLDVAAMLALNLVYQFWLHTELIPPLGFLEGVLNTPSNHRVHHSIEESLIDKNYGGILIIFDRIFGTYAPEPRDIPIRYGLLGKSPSFNPVKIFFREWVAMLGDCIRAKGLSHKLRYLFGAPGWQPQVSTVKKIEKTDKVALKVS